MVWGKSDLYGVGTQTVILKDYIAKKAKELAKLIEEKLNTQS